MAGFQLVVLSEISQDQNETSSLKRKYSRYRKQKYFQSLHEELSQKISVPVFRDTRLCILPETREFSELMDSLPVAGGFRCRRSLTRRNVLSGETGRRLTFWHCLRCVSFRTRTRPARAPESSVHCSVGSPVQICGSANEAGRACPLHGNSFFCPLPGQPLLFLSDESSSRQASLTAQDQVRCSWVLPQHPLLPTPVGTYHTSL
ncbi:uncharacterized protein LOC121028322 isoform X3 [Herpailurus yagouaroundi]|uniref:uncharacterized protein LOC121028322 isoform X3 n=1 Tax=Herpailurus yagouaroundi TaxID=1608482 RepID=UPI001AD76873|nr:uncharacterized protein LOC121028322 isoform X3 [Puma yagouaroundi]